VKKKLFSPLLFLASSSLSAAFPEGKVYSSHLMVEQEVEVASRITGIIETIHVDRGTFVGKGQPLATLDPRALDMDVRESKENMDLRKAEFERAQALSEGNVMSKAELDEKRARFAVAVATYEKAKALRDRAVIRAPFAGVVSEKHARVGQKVIEIQNAPLFKITAFEPLLARVYLPEEDLLRVKIGDPVTVVPVKFPDARTTGRVQFIGPTVDAASGTFQVIIRVRREPGRSVLRPGLAVKVQFTNKPRA